MGYCGLASFRSFYSVRVALPDLTKADLMISAFNCTSIITSPELFSCHVSCLFLELLCLNGIFTTQHVPGIPWFWRISSEGAKTSPTFKDSSRRWNPSRNVWEKLLSWLRSVASRLMSRLKKGTITKMLLSRNLNL